MSVDLSVLGRLVAPADPSSSGRDLRPERPRRMAHRVGRGPTRSTILARGFLPSGRAARLGWLAVGASAVFGLAIVLGRFDGLGGAVEPAPLAQPGPSAEAAGWPPPASSAVTIDPLDLATKFALVGLLLYGGLRLLRRYVAPTADRNGPIVVLASRPLGAKAALHLVAVGDRRLLVGESPSGLVGLTELVADELESDQVRTIESQRREVGR